MTRHIRSSAVIFNFTLVTLLWTNKGGGGVVKQNIRVPDNSKFSGSTVRFVIGCLFQLHGLIRQTGENCSPSFESFCFPMWEPWSVWLKYLCTRLPLYTFGETLNCLTFQTVMKQEKFEKGSPLQLTWKPTDGLLRTDSKLMVNNNRVHNNVKPYFFMMKSCGPHIGKNEQKWFRRWA